MEGPGADDLQPVTGKTFRPTKRAVRFAVAAAVLYVAYVGYVISTGRFSFLLGYVIFAVRPLYEALRPPTVVSTAGISRPWCRKSFVSWIEVESVMRLELGYPSVRLLLSSGKTLVLADIPADRSADVAALGEKQVIKATLSVPRPAPTHHEPSARDLEADVNRRADALAAGWAKLAAQNQHNRNHHPQ